MSGVWVSYSPPEVSLVFKPATGTHYFWYLTPGLRYPVCGSNPSLPREDLWVISSSSPVFPPGGTGLDLIAFPPSLTNSVWLFLYRLDYRRNFLPLSSLFSVSITPQVDLFLMCLCGMWAQHLPILPSWYPPYRRNTLYQRYKEAENKRMEKYIPCK